MFWWWALLNFPRDKKNSDKLNRASSILSVTFLWQETEKQGRNFVKTDEIEQISLQSIFLSLLGDHQLLVKFSVRNKSFWKKNSFPKVSRYFLCSFPRTWRHFPWAKSAIFKFSNSSNSLKMSIAPSACHRPCKPNEKKNKIFFPKHLFWQGTGEKGAHKWEDQ